jgi:hypothetical protein
MDRVHVYSRDSFYFRQQAYITSALFSRRLKTTAGIKMHANVNTHPINTATTLQLSRELTKIRRYSHYCLGYSKNVYFH